MPSALGSALRSCFQHDPCSVSSSASSTAWSVVTDDEYERSLAGDSDLDSIYDCPSKSASFLRSSRSSGLSFSRRPSGTNNRSTVTNLHRKTSSSSSSSLGHVVPCSAPIHSHSRSSYPEDEDSGSDYSYSTQDYAFDGLVDPTRVRSNNKATITKPKRARNRASLPAYFSLLQIGSTSEHSSSGASSSAHTVARPSPPTPKLPLAGLTSGHPHASGQYGPEVYETPRGRRREPGASRSSRRSGHSSSSSPSRSRANYPALRGSTTRARVESKSSVEQVFDWSSAPMPRGRAAIRRNSSPPPKMLLNVLPPLLADRSQSGRSGSRKSRGRITVQDLDGNGGSAAAPGYGYGRSGLLNRERARHHAAGELL
ncbi:hypothetical protein HGRIS_012936 [Hohenbuehelia grisea]|uniref:Uncharacterized protein n=1 Tax=Hohenbuehelia grisea TaxID=104357 RepID=A0ABR3ITU8_9AGAR